VKGVREGESVVSAGTFLVDSESRLQVASNSGNATGETAVAKPTLHRSLQSKVDDPMKAGMEHSMN
jgi:hypothetical protein